MVHPPSCREAVFSIPAFRQSLTSFSLTPNFIIAARLLFSAEYFSTCSRTEALSAGEMHRKLTNKPRVSLKILIYKSHRSISRRKHPNHEKSVTYSPKNTVNFSHAANFFLQNASLPTVATRGHQTHNHIF
ncbi:hypothetical protein NL108_013091 [Boleophthalmus pectinirostris]|nr:hypothetical protein NL108_013091 [Boleophthalmus pectinirostris]